MAALPAPSTPSDSIKKNSLLPGSSVIADCNNLSFLLFEAGHIAHAIHATRNLTSLSVTLVPPELEEISSLVEVVAGATAFHELNQRNFSRLVAFLTEETTIVSIMKTLKTDLKLINTLETPKVDIWTLRPKYINVFEAVTELNQQLRSLYATVIGACNLQVEVPFADISQPSEKQEIVPHIRQYIESIATIFHECVTVAKMISCILVRNEAYPGDTWTKDALTLIRSDLNDCLAARITTPL